MKRPNIVLGLIGGLVSLCVAPALAINGMYILGILTLVAGVTIIDWNRQGN